MLNMDFAQRVVVETAAQARQPSPMAGVWRNPHLSEHDPWVENEAVLWVKIGHLKGAGT